MKKPEKQTPLCPLIQSECVEEGCKFWLQMERRNIATGAVEKYQECAIVVQVGVVTENSMILNRLVATVQDQRNELTEAIRSRMVALNGRTA